MECGEKDKLPPPAARDKFPRRRMRPLVAVWLVAILRRALPLLLIALPQIGEQLLEINRLIALGARRIRICERFGSLRIAQCGRQIRILWFLE